MTQQLDRNELFAPDDENWKNPAVFVWARVSLMIADLERLAREDLPTLPEKTDADEALRSLRHLRKQLEGISK